MGPLGLLENVTDFIFDFLKLKDQEVPNVSNIKMFQYEGCFDLLGSLERCYKVIKVSFFPVPMDHTVDSELLDCNVGDSFAKLSIISRRTLKNSSSPSI